MSNQRQYSKVSGGSENKRWEPNKSNAPIDEKNPPMIEGYYLKANEITGGPNGPFMVHEIQTLNPDGSLGECFDVSLGVGLDNTLSRISLGTFICIQYKGKKASKTPGRSFNNTEVFKDDNAIPHSELSGKGAVVGTVVKESNKTVPPATNAAKNPAANSIANPFPEDDDLPF